MTITVEYSCAGCGLKDRHVQVRARADDEDVVAWTREMGATIGRDHAIVSPACSSQVCSEVKVPIGDRTGHAARIGDPVREEVKEFTPEGGAMLYVLVGWFCRESWVEGVFSTEAKAQGRIDRLAKGNRQYHDPYEIVEMQLDSDSGPSDDIRTTIEGLIEKGKGEGR